MIMGLPFSVHLRYPSSFRQDEENADAVGTIDAVVEEVWDSLRWADRVFSTYRQDSDISRIRNGQLRVRDADPAVAQVLDFAEIARRLTGGAFDVNGPRPRRRDVTGTRPVRTTSDTLDPSGIVKGWAASRAAAPLTTLGMDHYLNAGGDVLLRSTGLDHPWRIGIEHPDDPDAANTSGIRRPGNRPAASRRPPSSALPWCGRMCWQLLWSPAALHDWTTLDGHRDMRCCWSPMTALCC
jgi:thiamine biosynthesis lipoprotein